MLGFIYGSERAVNELSAALAQIYPGSGARSCGRASTQRGRALALGLGLLGTIVTVTTIHGALDASLAAGSGVPETDVVRASWRFAFAGGLLLLAIPRVLSAGVELLRGPIASVTAFALFY